MPLAFVDSPTKTGSVVNQARSLEPDLNVESRNSICARTSPTCGYSGNLVGRSPKRPLLEGKRMEFAAWSAGRRRDLGLMPERRKSAPCRAFGLVGAGVWCIDEPAWVRGRAAGRPQIYPL